MSPTKENRDNTKALAGLINLKIIRVLFFGFCISQRKKKEMIGQFILC